MPPLRDHLPLPPADSCLLLSAPLSTLATYKPLFYLAKCPAHFCTIDARCIMDANTKLYHNSKHPKMFQPHFILSGFPSLAGDCQTADPVSPSCLMMYGLCFHFYPHIQLDCEGCRVTWLITVQSRASSKKLPHSFLMKGRGLLAEGCRFDCKMLGRCVIFSGRILTWGSPSRLSPHGSAEVRLLRIASSVLSTAGHSYDTGDMTDTHEGPTEHSTTAITGGQPLAGVSLTAASGV